MTYLPNIISIEGEKTVKNQSSAIEQLDRYIRARYPAITILSQEAG